MSVVYGESRFTWADLDTEISRVANALLRRLPDSPKGRVVIIMENRPDYLAVLYGAQRAGMVPAPTSTRFVGREIKHVFDTAEPSLCVCSVHYLSHLVDAFSEREKNPPVVVIGGDARVNIETESWDTFVSGVSTDDPKVPLSENDFGVQLFTAGTTGLPKGSNFTHRALLDACTLIPDHGLKLIFEGRVPESALLPQDFELKFLVPTPLYHLSGFMPAIIMTAMKRPVVFPTALSFSPEEVCALIEQEKITSVFMVPTQFRLFLDFPDLQKWDLSSVTLLSS
ncbi:MAG: AMP-binding protein, partial [Candidatus Thorarchaeota archaeon]